MLITPKRLKLRTSNLGCMFPGTVRTCPLKFFSKRDVARVTSLHVFWALNASKTHLRSPRWGSLQRFPKPHSWLGGGALPIPKNLFSAVVLQPQILALRASGVHPKTNCCLRPGLHGDFAKFSIPLISCIIRCC